MCVCVCVCVCVCAYVLSRGPHAVVLYSFSAEGPGELSISKGDRVELVARLDASWLKGKCQGKEGIFPAEFVEVIVDLPVEVVVDLPVEVVVDLPVEVIVDLPVESSEEPAKPSPTGNNYNYVAHCIAEMVFEYAEVPTEIFL